ncbi:hypothetical protein V1519DRAFT_91705 [Lipomyces tetrasporus]
MASSIAMLIFLLLADDTYLLSIFRLILTSIGVGSLAYIDLFMSFRRLPMRAVLTKYKLKSAGHVSDALISENKTRASTSGIRNGADQGCATTCPPPATGRPLSPLPPPRRRSVHTLSRRRLQHRHEVPDTEPPRSSIRILYRCRYRRCPTAIYTSSRARTGTCTFCKCPPRYGGERPCRPHSVTSSDPIRHAKSAFHEHYTPSHALPTRIQSQLRF